MSNLYLEQFKENINNISKLEELPKLIIESANSQLENLKKDVGYLNIENKIDTITKSLSLISNVSINKEFALIYNQMCILLVSSVESALKDYFVQRLNSNPTIFDKKEWREAKVSISEIIDNGFNFENKIGELILTKDNSLNFQDFKAIKRNFGCVNKSISLDKEVEKKISFYFEVRHVLVHKMGLIDESFISKTNNFESNIKSYSVGDVVQITGDDWSDMKLCFTKLIASATENTT